MAGSSASGTWCSGITSASHAEGPGFKSRCVQTSGPPVESERGDQALCKLTGMVLVRWQGAASVRMRDFARDLGSGHSQGCAYPPCTAPHAITLPPLILCAPIQCTALRETPRDTAHAASAPHVQALRWPKLRCTALDCTARHDTAPDHAAIQYTAPPGTELGDALLHCATLQHSALQYCNTLPSVTLHCTTSHLQVLHLHLHLQLHHPCAYAFANIYIHICAYTYVYFFACTNTYAHISARCRLRGRSSHVPQRKSL